MNFLDILGQEVKRTAEEYKAGRISVDQIRVRQTRLSKLRTRSTNLERIKAAVRETNGRAERALQRLRDALAEGGPIVAMDSASVEIRKLELTQSTFWTDTSFLGLVWYSDYPSLELLCQRYGIKTAYAHNSGNDSYRTLQVALSILEDKSPKRLNY